MKTDIEIAQSITLKPIYDIAEKIDLSQEDLYPYGPHMAKINSSCLNQLSQKEGGKLVLVTSINPTPAGEGKTTTNIGLSMALNSLGYSSITTLREPSLGPVFGIKGGAAGGGYSQVLPMEAINLHFTGDFHAITSANNLICAALDNHIHQGNDLGIDPKTVTFNRVLDMNDRALREIIIGLGPSKNGVVREDHFDIAVASEIMAVFCLAKDLDDLRDRVGRILLASSYKKEPIYVKDLGVEGAVTLLLKDALQPNLVQTAEHTPAIIHGGPFANIAHGCNSIIATKTAMKLCDYTITEAGFGADLGAEKFLDIVCPEAGLKPDGVVVVATIRALKYHGGLEVKDLEKEDIPALKRGYANLGHHVKNMGKFGLASLVAINRFPTDTQAEIDCLKKLCQEDKTPIVLSEIWAKGSAGGQEMARAVVDLCEKESNFAPLYDLDLPLEDKLLKLAKEIYGAGQVDYTAEARKELEQIKALGGDQLPICVAKTQMSISDDPNKKGAPQGHTLTVREMKLSNGAGFVVIKTGEIMTMPGLPKEPAANKMDVAKDGQAMGLF
ncbi:MAG: formate--tetrahydrofolate ligase [Tissierellia bacterium]|nr:formate--tetrahydrofolate ligase [Tissierellia bacterium]